MLLLEHNFCYLKLTYNFNKQYVPLEHNLQVIDLNYSNDHYVTLRT